VLMAGGWCLTIGVLVVGPWWTTRVRANPGGQTAPTVRQATIGQRLGSRPGEKGATYYALEAQTARVTMRFADAVAVGERTFEGDLMTRLSDTAGNELAR